MIPRLSVRTIGLQTVLGHALHLVIFGQPELHGASVPNFFCCFEFNGDSQTGLSNGAHHLQVHTPCIIAIFGAALTAMYGSP